MNISLQGLIQKFTPSQESSECNLSSEKIRFQEWMQEVSEDEQSKEKGFFPFLKEEEEKKENSTAKDPSSLPMNSPLPLLVTNTDLNPEKDQNILIDLSSRVSWQQSAVFERFPSKADPSSYLSSNSLDMLFEKMAETMIVMCSSEEMQTTLFLDQPQYASSVFFGSQITIREFSTAPKAFNIEIIATPAAIDYIHAGQHALLASFQKGHFNFSVHRIETYIQNEDRPVFHRREKGDQKNQDEQRGRERQ